MTKRRPPAGRPANAEKTRPPSRQTATRGRARLPTSSETLLFELLALPGPSGREAAVSRYLQQHIKAVGVPASQIHQDQAHRRSPLPGEVGNLIVRLPGTVRGPRRLLMAHQDTVPICVGCQPVREGNLVRSKNRATGLGADNRAGCAVLLHTLLGLFDPPRPHPPLTFVWTVQEEIGLQGARLLNLSRLGRPGYGFNWDGGAARKLTIGATGGYRMQIEVRGRASHAGGAPEMGVSAIAAAARAIDRLQSSGWHGAIQQAEGTGTSNIGVIRGGTATNVVADYVQLQAEARSHDARFRQRIIDRIEQVFTQAAAETQNIEGRTAEAHIQGRLDYEAFCLPTDHRAIQLAQQAVRRAGAEPELAVANGGLDANWLSARGIPTVTLGCGQLRQHTVDEALDLEQFHLACQIALDLATSAAEAAEGSSE